jgi:metal-responsive CopG/Arc/MetJ family transcriptional regulator
MGIMAEKRGRPKSDKLMIYSRIRGDLIARLDDISAEKRPVPTRAQMIELAVEEYVERHGKAKGKK